MGWKENLENITFSIKTGDGKVFYPLFRPQSKSKDYNTTVFNFINVPKSLVERRQPQSNKHELTFWFEGENCITQANEFEASADDSRMWEIVHPYYGTLKGQPMGLERNDENLNLSQLKVTFWESINVDYPRSNYSIKDNTFEEKNNVLDSSVASYSGGSFSGEDVQKNDVALQSIKSSFEDMQTNETNADFLNAYAEAQKANNNLVNDPLEAIQRTLALLDLPSSLYSPAWSRIQQYIRCYERIKTKLDTLSDKLFFESVGAAIIAEISYSAVTPTEEDYEIVSDVQFISEQVLVIYADYLQTLDDASVSIATQDSEVWQPDSDVQINLHGVVSFTVANLYELGFQAQQERIVYTTNESNLILLTHKYMGLDASDSNIEKFRKINDIKNNEVYRIKKDRKIIYYV